MTKCNLLVSFLLALLGINPVFAKYQSHESLESAVVNFLKSETQEIKDADISVQNFDQRLRLHQCSTDLEVFWPVSSKRIGNTTVGIRCYDNKPWKIYIGVHIHIYKSVWVTNAGLHRSQVIDLASVSPERRDVTRLTSGYILASTPIEGLVVKRNISANQVLTNNVLDSQKMVKRGDRITIISKYAGIEVRAAGVALNDGTKGERIRVKNTGSKREIEAYVSDKQHVLVTL